MYVPLRRTPQKGTYDDASQPGDPTTTMTTSTEKYGGKPWKKYNKQHKQQQQQQQQQAQPKETKQMTLAPRAILAKPAESSSLSPSPTDTDVSSQTASTSTSSSTTAATASSSPSVNSSSSASASASASTLRLLSAAAATVTATTPAPAPAPHPHAKHNKYKDKYYDNKPYEYKEKHDYKYEPYKDKYDTDKKDKQDKHQERDSNDGKKHTATTITTTTTTTTTATATATATAAKAATTNGVNKEAAPTPTPSIAASTSTAPVSLMDRRMRLNMEGVEKLVKAHSSFSVISCIGTQGVGKSTLLNTIAGFSTGGFAVEKTQPTADETVNTTTSTKTSAASAASASASASTSDTHCTNGVDVFITPERTILLDTQPLFSSSMLSALIREDVPLPASIPSIPSLHDAYQLQLVTWILSVSHLVIVMQSQQPDEKLHALIQQAIQKKTKLGISPLLRTASGNGLPDIVFVMARIPDLSFTDAFFTSCRAQLASMYTSFQHTGDIHNHVHPRVQSSSPISNKRERDVEPVKVIASSTSMGTGTSLPTAAAAAAAAAVETPAVDPQLVNVFFLPDITPPAKLTSLLLRSIVDHPKLASASSSSLFRPLLERLANQILMMPKQTCRHRCTERDWLRYGNRIWRSLLSSSAAAGTGTVTSKSAAPAAAPAAAAATDTKPSRSHDNHNNNANSSTSNSNSNNHPNHHPKSSDHHPTPRKPAYKYKPKYLDNT